MPEPASATARSAPRAETGQPSSSLEAFRLLAGQEALSDYQFGTKAGHHLFCRHCGVRSFGRGYVEAIGGDYVAVQLACLENADPAELVEAPVRYADGRNNNWMSPPAEIRHL